jgi:hypothetical protein
MGECPTCGRRIRGTVCPYCDEHIADDDADDSTLVSGESKVPVFASDEAWQIAFVMGLLESEGIPAYQESADSIDDLDNLLPEDMSGDTVVVVEEEDADRASEAIEASRSDLEDHER